MATLKSMIAALSRCRLIQITGGGVAGLLLMVPAWGQEPSPPAQPSPPETDGEDLFQRIFGQPRTLGEAQPVVVPFFLDGQEQGQVLVLFTPGGKPRVLFQAAPFLVKAESLLRPELQSQLQSLVDRQGNLSLADLLAVGLVASFDERRLELRVQVPPAQRRTSVYNLGEDGLPPEAQDALPPSRFSGYLNLRGGQEIVWSGQQGDELGRLPLGLGVEGALNWQGWVLEGSGTFTERANPALVRGDVRLVRDVPSQAVRYVAGDLSLPAVGYQNSLPLLGVLAARNFSLQPYRTTRPINEFEFFLDTPSRVEVFINGLLVQTLQLPAGRQDIRNLPLNTGINDVQLVITDAVGRVQRLNFPAAIASELLSPGLEQFAYGFGFPAQINTGRYRYQWDQPTLSLAYRRGLSNTLTLGSYFQGNLQQQLLGVEGAWASSLGNFGWDAALSHAGDIGADYAFRLRYDLLTTGRSIRSQRTLRLALEHRGSRFTTLGDLDALNDFAWDVSADYAQPLFWGIQSTLGIDYRWGQARTPDMAGVALGLSRSFRNGVGVNLNLSHRTNGVGSGEQRAFLNLVWLLPQRRQSILSTTEISSRQGPSSQITWNRSPLKTIGGLNTSVGALVEPERYGITGRLDYQGYRFSANLAHDIGVPQDFDGNPETTTQLSFGTALVFVDGYWGWSRPVTESFALVVPTQNLRGQRIRVNPGLSGDRARADQLGPAVVPNLQPYQVSTLQIEAPEAPLGYDAGPSSYTLLPSYKSGTLIRVGTEATVFVRGVLVDEQGNPLRLQTGEVVSLSEPQWQSVALFTNRAGRFVLEGLKPGQYEIRLSQPPPNQIRFEVPAGKTGVLDLGILRISGRAQSN